LRDGNCGFTGLGLTRTASIKQLIAQLTNADLAAMVRDDAREAFRGRELPPILMGRFQALASQLDEQEETISSILATLNDQYESMQRELGILTPKRLNVLEMIQYLEQEHSEEILTQRNLLIEAQRQRDTL